MVTVAMLALTATLSWFSTPLWLTRLDYAFYDKALRAIGDMTASDDIVIIAIDDSSIAQLGYWPWRRSVHAELLAKLKTARAVGFDLVMATANPAYPDDDAQLAAAIKQHGRVVLPVAIGADNSSGLAPLPVLAAAAAATGFVNIRGDGDGVMRQIALRHKLASGLMQDHFALALLKLGAQDTTNASDATRLIPYAGAARSFATYPYAQVLNGDVDTDAFHGKYVLVGSLATGLGRTFSTPLSRSGETMSGIEVVANVLNSALLDRWIDKPARWVIAMLSCLPVLLACLVLARLSPRQSFVATIAIMALVFLGNALLLRCGGIWLPSAAALIGIMFAHPAWTWRSQEAALQYIDSELRALDVEREKLGHSLTHASSLLAPRSFSARIVQLHTAVEQLRTARQRRDETVHYLSHDIRAPQNSLLALTQLQRENASGLSQDELLQRIDTYAIKTLKLVDGLVLLARAEAWAIQAHPVDLVALALQGCDDFWAQSQARRIRISLDQHPESAWITGDSELLMRAWCNLLENAIKYSPSHTTITCQITQEDGMWVMTVADQGVGIEEAQLTQLFKPFVRLPGAERQRGAGLGLALVQTVVRRHGG
nr:CHASE2 domain-containing protein [Pseudomonas sp.]